MLTNLIRLLVATVALFAAPATNAVVLYSNLGPDDTFASGGNLIGATSMGQRRIAMPFTTPPVRQYSFDAFEAPIWGADAIVQVSLCRDDNGQPGQVLASYVQVVDTAVPLRKWSSSQKPVLDGGQLYWIVVPTVEVRQLVWGSNLIGQRAGGLDRVGAGPWSPLDPDRSSPAYRITVVEAVGPCCVSSAGVCVITTVRECDAAGAVFGGNQAVCEPTFCPPAPPRGGCCNPAIGACTVTAQDSCEVLGGQWNGANTTCQLTACLVSLPTGACCRGATCEQSIGVFCSITGGRFLGNQTTCAPVANFNVCCPIDFNNSGEVSVQDLFDFLAGFFGGCP